MRAGEASARKGSGTEKKNVLACLRLWELLPSAHNFL